MPAFRWGFLPAIHDIIEALWAGLTHLAGCFSHGVARRLNFFP
ncbi:hypothetical protein [Aliamphritea spongicola]|nr:hypothetical protein [Aliamphritea spongicola]